LEHKTGVQILPVGLAEPLPDTSGLLLTLLLANQSYVVVSDGAAKRGAGAAIVVPIGSSQSAAPAVSGGVTGSEFDIKEDEDDATLSMYTDQEGDEILTSVCTDMLMPTDEQTTACTNRICS